MTLVRVTKTRLVFRLRLRERQALLRILRLYPCVPPAHHALSKSDRLPDAAANQQLLDEALAEQRAENKKRLQAFVAGRRFTHTKTGEHLSLTPADADWTKAGSDGRSKFTRSPTV